MTGSAAVLASLDRHFGINAALSTSQLREHQERGSCAWCDQVTALLKDAPARRGGAARPDNRAEITARLEELSRR